MTDWKEYIDLGAKMAQMLFQNTMILSGNELYNREELMESSLGFYNQVKAILNDIAPTYNFNYIYNYGFSDESIEKAHHNFSSEQDRLSRLFLSKDVRCKYMFLLGADLLFYKMALGFDGQINKDNYKRSIENKLSGANIPTRYVEYLENDISFFTDEVIAFLDNSESADVKSEKDKEHSTSITNSIVIIDSVVRGDIIYNPAEVNQKILEIEEEYSKLLKSDISKFDGLQYTLDEIKKILKDNKSPDEKLLTKLKGFCQSSLPIVTLIEKLINLFEHK